MCVCDADSSSAVISCYHVSLCRCHWNLKRLACIDICTSSERLIFSLSASVDSPLHYCHISAFILHKLQSFEDNIWGLIVAWMRQGSLQEVPLPLLYRSFLDKRFKPWAAEGELVGTSEAAGLHSADVRAVKQSVSVCYKCTRGVYMHLVGQWPGPELRLYFIKFRTIQASCIQLISII